MASGVFRVLDYIPLLEKQGIRCNFVNYSSPRLHQWLYEQGAAYSFWNKKNYSIYLERIYALIKMLYILLIAHRYDVVFIEKITPPKWWVRLLKKINERIVYDLDDAVFIQFPERTQYLIKNARRVVAGSHFILDHCRSLNSNTVFLPTPVPLHLYPEQPQNSTEHREGLTIGWAGTTGTIKYLSILQEPLTRLSKKYPGELRFIIIGHSDHSGELKSLFSEVNIEIIPFIDAKYISGRIAEFDIGVMPLDDGDWEKGKCALKALCYMSAHVPAICSRVGENIEVIQDGVNGFLASNEEEWILKLSQLIENPGLRSTLGAEGRKTIEKKYSTEVCFNVLVNQVLLKL